MNPFLIGFGEHVAPGHSGTEYVAISQRNPGVEALISRVIVLLFRIKSVDESLRLFIQFTARVNTLRTVFGAGRSDDLGLRDLRLCNTGQEPC